LTRRAKLFGCWYICIGAGFLLLGTQRMLVGGNRRLVVLRWVIGVLFLLLGWLHLRRPPRR